MHTIKSLAAILLSLLISGGLTTQAIAQKTLLERMGIEQKKEEFLPAKEAFKLRVSRISDKHFIAQWDIVQDYYLYRDKIKVVVNDESLYISKPPGQMIDDPTFGNVPIYRTQTAVAFEADAKQTAHITWQGCADAGLCYPPETELFALAQAPKQQPPATQVRNNAKTAQAASPPEHVKLANFLAQSKLLVAIFAFLGLGLLLAFTPCVLPMVPILSSVIASSPNAQQSSSNAFLLSLAYVLAMALTYSLAGIAIALSGSGFQLWFQHPAVISTSADVFALLAFAMFGFYNLQLPAHINARLSQIGQNRRGSLSGAAIMGVFSAIVVSPCVTPPLIGALLFVARSGDTLIGGVALFSLALGMGLPLLLIGTSLGRFFPKSGMMLEIAKRAAGFVMLGFAIWLLDRIASPSTTTLLSGLLIAAIGFYLAQVVATQVNTSKNRQATSVRAIARTIPLLIIAYGVLLTLHSVNGGSQWQKPWNMASNTQTSHDSKQLKTAAPHFPKVYSLSAVEKALQQNTPSEKPTMLVFYADWCVSCKELEQLTFSDETVQSLLAQTNTLEADITQPNANSRELLTHFSLFGPPAILFFDGVGREMESARLVGFVGADPFSKHLQTVLAQLPKQ